MVKTKVVNSRVGKTLYGALFVIVLPILLVVWSITLDRTIQWPIPQWPMIGLGIGLIGTGIMLKGMLDLYQYGRGLPMNAYPPEKYVTRGTYAWFSHPIYLGAVLLSAGVSLWYQSSSGLYLITPIFALMTVALVIGYERLAVRKRFGKMVKEHQPLFSWPTYPDTKITLNADQTNGHVSGYLPPLVCHRLLYRLYPVCHHLQWIFSSIIPTAAYTKCARSSLAYSEHFLGDQTVPRAQTITVPERSDNCRPGGLLRFIYIPCITDFYSRHL
jgi:protein-S-isoprenylcysteine O-methyltransferase Ste14